MKYFIDTEFIEGTQVSKCPFRYITGKRITKPTIDLISIGIVCEDGREYYAISKDFNLKEAWNRYDLKNKKYPWGNPNEKEKVYWIRENVLLPIYKEFISGDNRNRFDFSYSTMEWILRNYGKSNKQIAEEIKGFCKSGNWNENIESNESITTIGNFVTRTEPEFYGYYSDYDWVAFCWLFGKMMDLPKGFPMFAFDIQQQITEHSISKEQLLKEVPQINIHNSLNDARWNYNVYKWIQNKINTNA